MQNKVNITINSRTYTVVANEDEEYLRSLGDYINSKVNIVLSEGAHVMGERPLVLAALNICDEYFKLMNKSEPSEKLSKLLTENERLENEIRAMRRAEKDSGAKASETEEELEMTRKVLEETEEKVKFLEGQIKLKDTQIKKQKSEFAIREKERLDMMENK